MRDDRHKWPSALGANRPDLVQKHIELRIVPVKRQTVISGEITDCLAVSGRETAFGGGADIAHGENYCIRQRRDRVLVVNGPDLCDGWHADRGVAVSDMTAAYSVVELVGAGVEQLIATGTEFVASCPTASTSRLWHGFGILLYRHGTENRYRMHVRSPYLDAAWDMIERQIDVLKDIWDAEEAASWLPKKNDGASLSCREAR